MARPRRLVTLVTGLTTFRSVYWAARWVRLSGLGPRLVILVMIRRSVLLVLGEITRVVVVLMVGLRLMARSRLNCMLSLAVLVMMRVLMRRRCRVVRLRRVIIVMFWWTFGIILTIIRVWPCRIMLREERPRWPGCPSSLVSIWRLSLCLMTYVRMISRSS